MGSARYGQDPHRIRFDIVALRPRNDLLAIVRRDSESRSFDRKVRSPIIVAAGEDECRKPKAKSSIPHVRPDPPSRPDGKVRFGTSLSIRARLREGAQR